MDEAFPTGPEGLVGRVFKGRYRVTRVLAEGGMGSACLALDEDLHRHVVVKVPKLELLADRGFRARFEREVLGLLDLDHPHVTRVLDAGLTGPVPVLVIPYLGGGNLVDRIESAGGRLEPHDLFPWVLEVARALDFIHERDWLHRDVKPGNNMFDEHGNAFLGDFGIARASHGSDPSLTLTGTIVGSPRYLAPEVAADEPMGPASDQHSLATIVYECLSGHLPHEGDTALRILAKKATQPPTPLRDVAPDLPPKLAEVVMRGIARDPSKRHPSCEAFAIALQQAVEKMPATPRSAKPQTPPPVKPNAHTETLVPLDRGAAGLARQRLPRGPLVVGALVALALVAAWALTLDREVIPLAGVTRSPRGASSPEPALDSAPPSARASQGPAKTPSPTAPRREEEAIPGEAEPGVAPVEPITEPRLPAILVQEPNARGVATAVRTTDGATMLLVPGGTLRMGSMAGSADERPVHEALLSPFYIDEREVTWGQFDAYTAARSLSRPARTEWNPDDDHPVVNVDWSQAAAYCVWAGGRLPTEAEWEMAARGDDERSYPWGGSWRANCANAAGDGDDFTMTSPVGALACGASPYGALDMSGNVAEWVFDWHAPYTTTARRDPRGPQSGVFRVIRGGAYNTKSPASLRATYRTKAEPGAAQAHVGFRCAMDE